MKKCASCTKELPEAALHCVFCGAKQPAAPAVQPGLAKTAFGYSPNEVLDQLRGPGSPPAQAYPPPAQRPGPSQPPPSYGAPAQRGSVGDSLSEAQTVLAPVNAAGPGTYEPAPAPAPYQPPPAYAQKTQFAPPAAAPYQPPAPAYAAPAYAPPAAAPYQPPAPAYAPPAAAPSRGMGINAPNPHTPLPLEPMSGTPPYLAGHPARGAQPIEPWRQSLRLMMFVWGAVLLAAFATPTATDPTAFHWSVISADVPLAHKLPVILLAAIGLLGIVLAAIPMPSIARGLFAALFGLGGIFVPVFLAPELEWRLLLEMIGAATLVSGLLVRNEYTDSLLARLLVTIGVLCALAPLLIPEHGEIELVGLFKHLIDAPGKGKVEPILRLGLVVIVVTSLLAWIPGPATGGAKVFAWLVIVWPTAIVAFTMLLIGGHLVDHIKHAPFDSLMAWAPPAAYAVFTGYGVATVLGKQLE